MVWNKTPEDKVKAIVEMIRTTDKLSSEIATEFYCSAWLVEELSRQNLDAEERRALWNRRAKRSKLGTNNPMSGKTGMKHHNAVEVSRCMGYRTVFKPDWWTGNAKDSRIYEHVLVYCSNNNLTILPPKHVIHHIDGNIDNNQLENLQLLTISEHIKLHWRQRKEQRLSSNGVGNSVPEAQAIQKDDDIV
jgi:hypothetical protein